MSVTVVQSAITVLAQFVWNQKVSLVSPLGTVNVWLIVLSVLVGVGEPRSAVYLPKIASVLIEVVPEVVQPEKSPVSNPPLVIPKLPVAPTSAIVVALSVALPSVPVTVTV